MGTVAYRIPEEGQADILQKAAECFMERGYNATSIDDVARRLGSTKGRIYHFFASKADLFFAVAEVGMEMNFRALKPCLELDVPAAKKLRAMATAHCQSMMDTRHYQHAVWQGVEIHLRGATTPEQRERLGTLFETRNRYSDLFRDVMEEAKKDGHLNYPDVSIARQLMFVSLSSLLFWYKPRPGETEEDRLAIVQQCVDFAMKGLGEAGG